MSAASSTTPATAGRSPCSATTGWCRAYWSSLRRSGLDEALPILDEVEDTATDTLRRIEVITLDGARAWAYHYAHATDGFDRIERWADQDER